MWYNWVLTANLMKINMSIIESREPNKQNKIIYNTHQGWIYITVHFSFAGSDSCLEEEVDWFLFGLDTCTTSRIPYKA